MKRIVSLASLFVLSSLPSLAASTGTFDFTMNLQRVIAELSGPTAFWICVGCLAIGAVDWVRHHGEIGAIGKGMIGIAAVIAIAMSSQNIVSKLSGVTGLPL